MPKGLTEVQGSEGRYRFIFYNYGAGKDACQAGEKGESPGKSGIRLFGGGLRESPAERVSAEKFAFFGRTAQASLALFRHAFAACFPADEGALSRPEYLSRKD
jgi:hypothetical protein